MIVTYTKSGKTVRIEIADTHDWTDVVAWVMVKMGHTGTRTDDPEFDRILREKNELLRVSSKQGDKRSGNRAGKNTKAQ